MFVVFFVHNLICFIDKGLVLEYDFWNYEYQFFMFLSYNCMICLMNMRYVSVLNIAHATIPVTGDKYSSYFIRHLSCSCRVLSLSWHLCLAKVVDSCRVRRQNHDSNKLRHNKHDKEGAPQQWCVTKIILFGKRPDMTNHNELQTRHGDDVWSKPKTTGDCTCC